MTHRPLFSFLFRRSERETDAKECTDSSADSSGQDMNDTACCVVDCVCLLEHTSVLSSLGKRGKCQRCNERRACSILKRFVTAEAEQ